MTFAYPLAKNLKMKYDFEISQHVSQIALVSDVSVKQNAMETLVGNPDISPNRVTSHDLRLTYSTPKIMSELQGYWRLNANCNMEKYTRKDGHFYQTQTNEVTTAGRLYQSIFPSPSMVVSTVFSTLQTTIVIPIRHLMAVPV